VHFKVLKTIADGPTPLRAIVVTTTVCRRAAPAAGGARGRALDSGGASPWAASRGDGAVLVLQKMVVPLFIETLLGMSIHLFVNLNLSFISWCGSSYGCGRTSLGLFWWLTAVAPTTTGRSVKER